MAKKTKGGRPPRHAGEHLTKNRTFRIRASLDEKMRDAAKKEGRSVSEEIEHRLEESFYHSAFRQIADDAQEIIDETTKAAAEVGSRVAAESVLEVFKRLLARAECADLRELLSQLEGLVAHVTQKK